MENTCLYSWKGAITLCLRDEATRLEFDTVAVVEKRNFGKPPLAKRDSAGRKFQDTGARLARDFSEYPTLPVWRSCRVIP